jgi:hypothetical protein
VLALGSTDCSAAGLELDVVEGGQQQVLLGGRSTRAGPVAKPASVAIALIVAASQPSRTIVRHVASMSLIRRS